MKTSAALLLVLGVVLAAPLNGALSAPGAGSPKIDDPSGDSTAGHADIQSIAAVKAAGQITWTIATYDSVTEFTAPCVFVKSVNPAGLKWNICRLSKGAAPPCYTSVSSSRPYPLGGGCSGPATIHLAGTKTVVYTVPLSMFRKWKPSPHAIVWRAEVRALKGCYPTPCDQTSFGHTAF